MSDKLIKMKRFNLTWMKFSDTVQICLWLSHTPTLQSAIIHRRWDTACKICLSSLSKTFPLSLFLWSGSFVHRTWLHHDGKTPFVTNPVHTNSWELLTKGGKLEIRSRGRTARSHDAKHFYLKMTNVLAQNAFVRVMTEDRVKTLFVQIHVVAY